MPYTISVGQWMIPQLKENNENSFFKKNMIPSNKVIVIRQVCPCPVGESLSYINHVLMIITNLRWLEACSILYCERPIENYHQL